MTSVQSIRAPVIGILIIELAALIARAYIELDLQADGFDNMFSADLSYLVVPPILTVLLYPVLRDHRRFLLGLFKQEHLTLKLVLSAIGIGLLIRIAWWCQLVFRISTGITTTPDPDAIAGPLFNLGCPPPSVILLGIFVMAVLVPVIEEVINRGLIQSTLAGRGKVFSIVTSAIIFAAFHPAASYLTTFPVGLIFGVQFWNSRTLWFSLITHTTYNGMAQLDWRCATGYWNPNIADLPLVQVALYSVTGLIISILLVRLLIQQNTVEVR